MPHKQLCDKLATYEIQGKTLEWISDFFLSNRTQKILVGSKISNSVDVLSRLPQGTILGLFVVHVTLMTYPTPLKAKLECILMIL